MAAFPHLESKCTWYHSPVGFVMTIPVDDPEKIDKEKDGLFEVSIRQWVDPKTREAEKFRWAVDATNEKVLSNFTVRSLAWLLQSMHINKRFIDSS